MKQKGNLAELVTKGFLETKLYELREEIDENARKHRDQILTGIDKVVGELQTIRELRRCSLESTLSAYLIIEQALR